MNTQKGKKAQNKGKTIAMGQHLPNRRTQPSEVDASREIYQAKINKLLIEWYQSTMFPIGIDRDWVIAALCHVSDLSLKTTFDAYERVSIKAIETNVDEVEFTYQDMDLVLQAFSHVNAAQMDMGLGTYLHFKDQISAIAQEFDKTFNENKERILAENPFVETNIKGFIHDEVTGDRIHEALDIPEHIKNNINETLNSASEELKENNPELYNALAVNQVGEA